VIIIKGRSWFTVSFAYALFLLHGTVVGHLTGHLNWPAPSISESWYNRYVH